MRRLEGDALPAESRGQIIPYGFGDVLLDVPGIPLQIGDAATLADNCGVNDSVTTLRLSGPDLAAIFAARTPPYVVALDSEWLRVSAQDDDAFTLTISDRGFGGTVAAAHEKGATVVFLESRALYVFLDAPPGLRYPDNALVQLRLNDVAQTPPCTVRLQDTRIIPGARLVTAEFDLTRYFGGVAPAPAATTLRIAEADGGRGPGASGPTALRMGGLSGPRGQKLGVVTPPIPAGPPQSALTRADRPTRRAPTRIITLRSSPLGQVTADLRGLLDTVGGRYTGTPSAPIVRGADVARVIAETTFGLTRFYEPDWAATQAAHASAGLTWRILWAGADFRTFREAASLCGLADLWFDEAGRCRYTWQDRAAAPVATIEDLIGQMPITPVPPSATRLAVTWGDRLQSGAFTLDSPTMQARYGVIEDRGLALPYVASETVARTCATAWLAAWDHPRLSGAAGLHHRLAHLSLTDSVMVETPLLALYGARRVPWQIRGITDRLEARTATLIEGDPIAADWDPFAVAYAGDLLEP